MTAEEAVLQPLDYNPPCDGRTCTEEASYIITNRICNCVVFQCQRHVARLLHRMDEYHIFACNYCDASWGPTTRRQILLIEPM